MYSLAGLEDKIGKAKKNGNEKVFVALNVYRKTDGTCQLSQEDNMGNYWSLLMNITYKNSYYGDSPSWPLPSNLKSSVKTTLDLLSADLNMNALKIYQF